MRQQQSHAAVVAVVALAVLALVGTAAAEVTWTLDKAAWTASYGGQQNVTDVDFGTLTPGTIVTEQFADLGVHFTDGDDRVVLVNPWGPPPTFNALKSYVPGTPPGEYDITIILDGSMSGFGVRPTGPSLDVQFWQAGALVGEGHATSVPYWQSDPFIGFQSSVSFDKVVILHHTSSNPAQGVTVGNLAFAIPAPGALGVAVVAAAFTRRRRASAEVSPSWTPSEQS